MWVGVTTAVSHFPSFSIAALLHQTAGQGDGGRLGHVSRADVAAVAIAALDHPAASARKTIDLSVKAHNTPPADQLLHVFDGTVPDD